MTISVTTVTNSIAAISVSGVTIKDIDQIPDSVLDRDCPVLYPEPDNFISGISATRQSFGTGGSTEWNVEYDMTYTFLFCSVGTGRGLLDVFDDMVSKAMAVIDAILINDNVTGAVDLTFQDVLTFGVVIDPAGNPFLGAQITFHVLEFE